MTTTYDGVNALLRRLELNDHEHSYFTSVELAKTLREVLGENLILRAQLAETEASVSKLRGLRAEDTNKEYRRRESNRALQSAYRRSRDQNKKLREKLNEYSEFFGPLGGPRSEVPGDAADSRLDSGEAVKATLAPDPPRYVRKEQIRRAVYKD